MVVPDNPSDRLRLAVQVGSEISEALTEELERFDTPRAIPPHMHSVGELYLRAISHYRAILVLADKEIFLQEPTSLSRSLFEDALRLALIADMNEEERADAISTWNLDGIERGIDVMVRLAEEYEVGEPAVRAQFAEQFEKDREGWTRYRRDKGSGRADRLLYRSDDPLIAKAIELDMGQGWWMHEMGDQTVHGNLIARAYARTVGEEGVATLATGQRYPRAIVAVINFAAIAVVLAHEKAFEMFGIEPQSAGMHDALDRLEELAGD